MMIYFLCCYLLQFPTAADTYKVTANGPANANATDSINVTWSLRDGETLVSAAQRFELGFSNLSSSKNRYLCIWYYRIKTVVWVANKENPVTDLSGVLRIDDRGILTIESRHGGTIWSSSSAKDAANPVAKLLDSGNFIVKNKGGNNSEDDYLWQSFDYPTDSLLPAMKLRRNKLTDLDANISFDDPAQGKFTFGFSQEGYPEMILTRGSKMLYRGGPWNNVRFNFTPGAEAIQFRRGFTFNQNEVYFSYELPNSPFPSRMAISQEGHVHLLVWLDRSSDWSPTHTLVIDQCDIYGQCGPYGNCDIMYPKMCSCLRGFIPKNQTEWDIEDWSGGCVRETPLTCSRDRFLKYSSVKLPKTQQSWSSVAGYMDKDMSPDECHSLCANKCDCTAYTNIEIGKGRRSCLLWFGELIDIREYFEGGQEIHVRVAPAPADQPATGSQDTRPNNKAQVRIAIVTSSVLATGLLLLVLALVLYRQKNGQKYRRLRELLQIRDIKNKGQKEDAELTLFDMITITQATNNFSLTNKLGEGGFGPVYKGILNDGQEIAVKKLSKNSGQGLDEFKNEVMYISKLQHRNLVKMLGCCIEADERILVYEFMPNKSLDFFIFDQTQSILLDWPKRFQILNGIARGLLYLHQDSRLRIIHRDLKTANILLDSEMNPKISDFGLARSFTGNEIEANTNKVVGTYGYMSPEYAIDGLYSTKSDIFSFGVMVLEVISGKRNRGFYHPQHRLNLLGHAWTLYKEGKCVELIQEGIITNQSNQNEALRSIKVGLLCVQWSPELRPNMSTVVFMLGGGGELPEPDQPGFFTDRAVIEAMSSSSSNKTYSSNNVTISLPGPR